MRNAPVSERPPVGLFVGLATLDVVHRVEAPPGPNEKITAATQFVAAGGPAANAAVAFAALGGTAVLVTALGDDAVAGIIRADLQAYGVQVTDAAAGTRRAVPVSSVTVVEATGDRSVVSLDAVNSEAEPPPDLDTLVADADVLLVDGHHPLLARAAVRAAAARSLPCVVDAGRWKPVMADLSASATDMVCSNDFRTPGADSGPATAAALIDGGVDTVVTTAGGEPVQWWSGGQTGTVPVPSVTVVDTLGAGDVFHGAYCYHRTDPEIETAERVERAAGLASLRCSVVGPRAWLNDLYPQPTGRRPQ